MDNSVRIYQAWLAELKDRPQTGDAFEAWVLHQLTARGWHLQPTPQSGDYGADLVGTDGGGVRWVIQAKNWAKAPGVHAVQEVIAARVYYDADRAMVASRVPCAEHAIQLARKADVELRTLAQF